MTPFDRAVAEVRESVSPAAVASRLVDELSTAERLGLLDGDDRFWRGALRWAREGYNRTPVVAGCVSRLGLPGLRFADGPRGATLGISTCFPVAMARGATWDVDLEAEVGAAIGAEVRAQGGNLWAGVCVNLLRHPAWGRAQETYGEASVHVGAMGAAATRGAASHVIVCVKHLAANSIDNARFIVDVHLDDDVLHEVYLPHFRDCLDAGALAVMSAYNRVNGAWCGESRVLLTEILRDEWGFSGVVISDFVWGLRDPVASVRAGLDVEFPFRQQRAKVLPRALGDGSLKAAEVTAAARRVVATQLAHAARAIEPPSRTVVACAAHVALSRRVAARSMVLLRNEVIDATPVLPLPATLGQLAVIGRLATAANTGDRGSSKVTPPSTSSPLEGLAERWPCVQDDGTDPARAAQLAAASDAAVLIVGHRDVDEGEYLFAVDDAAMSLLPWPGNTWVAARGVQAMLRRFERQGGAYGGDRASLGLRAEDEALIAAVVAAQPRTVVVVIAGSAVTMEAWRQRAPAILYAWYPGMEGGRALADVLAGDAEPTGRLPFVIPRDASQLPAFDRNAREIRYQRWHGQALLERQGQAPAFPLGFGLGYTTWSYDDVRIDGTTAVVRVRNAGLRAGRTVVQLYARRAEPPRSLVGFAVTEVAAGASVDVRVPWSPRAISCRDAATRVWSVPPGPWTLEAARFAGDPAAVCCRLPYA